MAIFLKNLTMPVGSESVSLTINSDGSVHTGRKNDVRCEAVGTPEPNGELIEYTDELRTSLSNFTAPTGLDEAPYMDASEWIDGNARTILRDASAEPEPANICVDFNKIKYTIEATPTAAVISLEIAGDTFRQIWIMDKARHVQTEDEPFWKQAQKTGKYTSSELDIINLMFGQRVGLLNYMKFAEKGTYECGNPH